MPKPAPGLYEALFTAGLTRQVAALPEGQRAVQEALDASRGPHVLARHLHDRLVSALRATPDIGGQVALINRLLETIEEAVPRARLHADDRVAPPGRTLRAILETSGRLDADAVPARPAIPLDTSDLLVNGPRDLRIGREVARELASADRVDLLCSFLKHSGLRLIRAPLRAFLARRPGGLRILTTTYMGATDQRAVEDLLAMGASLKVSYDAGRTRLHAKAWLFHRESGFSTAYIGSSNLSHAAMLDGMEWNVRLAQVDNPAVLAKFRATFDHYWSDPEFADYDAARFEQALRSRRDDPAILTAIEVRPYPHQEEILEALAQERRRGHSRNLVVAATGTGKTIIAALDYRRLRRARGGASLLFVAHRKEILKQSRATFQAVLRDGAFGELLVDGERPREGRHVFASVQSLRGDRLARLAPDAYDVVIVDEFHHAAAPTYTRLLERLTPKVLLGLTATPERADGASVLGWFNERVAAELRLWTAIDQGLLAPFHYFGVNDGTDLRDLGWARGRYADRDLENVYTAGDVWVNRVLREVADKISNPSRMRALGFCVSIRHAEFMAARFERAGLAARAVTSRTSAEARAAALRALAAGDLRVLFAVDLFNEGVDIPAVDTVLFLRPTESATIFLQQLGRGLRRADGKDCLTVLDFIGNAHRSFRYDVRFRALLGGTRRATVQAVEADFPRLPAGCAIQLDPIARDHVLENIRRALNLGYRGLVEDLRGLGRDVGLAAFLKACDIAPADLYLGAGHSWTRIRRAAGLPVPPAGPDEARWLKPLARLLHIDDAERLGHWRAWISAPSPPLPAPTGGAEDRLQRMLSTLLGRAEQLAALWRHPAARAELAALLDTLNDRARAPTWPFEPSVPLRVHGTYALDEVMAAFHVLDRSGSVFRLREGVKRVEAHRCDLLFITLEKTAADYSPTTMYDDYAIGPASFHWQSQSGTHDGTKTGQRYIHHARTGDRVLLFVRRRRKDTRRETCPYVFLGEADYVEHHGGRPMSIIWALRRPMPARLYQSIKVAAG